MVTLVLLPGMDGTGTLFDEFQSALGVDMAVRFVSYPDNGPQTYAELERHARKALPTDTDYIVLGESFSGPIAVSIAASRPKGLVGVILCASFVRNPRPLLAPWRHVLGLLPIFAAPSAAINAALLGRFATPTLRSALASALSRVSANTLRERLQAVVSVDVSAQLKTIEVPVLYLLAQHDRVVPRAALEHILRQHPATRVECIDAPHFLLQAAPAAAATVIGRFISPKR